MSKPLRGQLVENAFLDRQTDLLNLARYTIKLVCFFSLIMLF